MYDGIQKNPAAKIGITITEDDLGPYKNLNIKGLQQPYD